MNLRNVLSAYSKLRQLTDDESALLETLRGLNDAERESLVLALQPEKTATKRAGRKSNKPASKSSRASGMAAAISGNLQAQREAAKNDDGKGMAGPLCQICGNFAQYEDHFKPSPNYHEFDAGKSAAQPARGKSSTNGGATTSTPSSETETADASSVHHAGG